MRKNKNKSKERESTNDSVLISNLFLQIGKKVILDSISLKINSKLALVGPNGSGKTSLIAAISGFMRYQKGSINIIDKNGNQIDSNKVGIAIQSSDFDREETVINELRYYCELSSTGNTEIDRLLIQLKKYSINPDEKIKNLPHGKWKIIMILQAMINSPGLLLLDEPFSGLDIVNRRIVEKILKEYNGNMLITSHILDEVSRICSRIAFINNGKLLEEKAISKIDNLEKYYIKLFS